jgi:F-type H+-transporting ATPase subunit b
MQIDWWTLALQAVNFLVLVWLLQRFLFKPVKQVIEKRKALAGKAFEEAAAAKAEAEAAQKDYQDKRSALEEERQSILKQAHESLEAERAKLLDQAKKEAEDYRKNALADLEEERRRALKGLRAEIAETATGLAATLLAKSGAQPNHAEVLEQIAGKLASLAPEEQDRLARDLDGEQARLEVVTATALSKEEQGAWRSRLQSLLPAGDGKLHFSQDPQLLGGGELRLPHAAIKFTWADQLSAAGEELSADETAQ